MVLRVLPLWYRVGREDELLAVLVEDSDDLTQEYGWPSAREVGGIVALAVRTRLTHPGAPARTVAWRRVLAWTGVLGLLVQAVFAVTVAVGLALAAAQGGVVNTGLAGLGAAGATQGWWELTRLLLPLAAAGGWALLVVGHHRAASVLVLLGLVPSALASDPAALLTWASLLVLLPGAPALVRGRRWLLALPAGVLLVPLGLLVPRDVVFTPDVLCSVALAAAAVAVLARHRAWDPAFVLALALLGFVEVPAALALLDLGTAVPLVLCLVAAVLLGVLGWSRMPRLSRAALT